MEDGRAIDQGGKYRKAQQCNTKILTEAELEELIQKLSGKPFRFGEKRARITENVQTIIKEGAKTNESEMWTEKYRPKSINDLIGNAGVIDNLYEWLKDWDEVVLRGRKKEIKF